MSPLHHTYNVLTLTPQMYVSSPLYIHHLLWQLASLQRQCSTVSYNRPCLSFIIYLWWVSSHIHFPPLLILYISSPSMSAAFIEGTLALSHGWRPSSSPFYYSFYTSVLKCSNGHLLPIDLQTYSPPHDTILHDETTVHVVGRFFAPPSGVVLIDVLSLTPFPGNPSDDGYDDNLPHDPTPRITIVGGVTNNPPSTDDSLRSFNVNVSEYVRDFNKTFLTRYC